MENKSKLLLDIKNGFSFIDGCFIKHPSLVDDLVIEAAYGKAIEVAKRNKLLTLEDSLARANKEGTWTAQEEKTLEGFKKMLSRSIDSQKKVIERMKDQLQGEIDKTSNKIADLEMKRLIAIGRTQEKWADRYSYEQYMCSLVFKDQALTQRLFLDEDFEYASDEDIARLNNVFIQFQDFVDYGSIKTLAASVKCQNYFFVSDNCKEFFGRNVLDLTHLQKDLFLLIKIYSNIIQDMRGKVADECLTDWIKIEEWRDGNERTREAMGGAGNSSFNYEKIKSGGKQKGTSARETAKLL